MATSGSSNYNSTTQEILQLALFHVGKYANGRTPDVQDFNITKRILNHMMKSWSAQGLHLWAKEEGILFLDQYRGEYNLSELSTSANFTLRDDAIITETSTTIAVSATSIPVLSTANMAVGDNIGIVVNGGSTFWTTIATIPNSTSLTLTNAITTAAGSGTLVYTYTSRAVKPMRVLDARLISGFDNGSQTSQIEIPMAALSYQDYWQMAVTTQNAAVVNQYHYNPKVNDGILYVWPRPSDTSYRLQISYERVLQDLDNISDNFDLPVEWLEAIQWQLALRIAPGFGARDRLPEIGKIAAEALAAILDWDNEITSVYFQPDIGYYSDEN